MLCKQFPDLQWLKKQAETRFSNRIGLGGAPLSSDGWPTVLLNVRTTETYRDHIPGPFSLFSNLTGSSWVEVDGHRKRIAGDTFLLTNPGQRYTLEVEKTETPTETFNIHFGDLWAEEAINVYKKTAEWMLDHPSDPHTNSVEFHQQLHRKDSIVKRILQLLRQDHEEGPLRRDELLFQLVSHLLGEQLKWNARVRELPMVKAGSRHEIARRLSLATDYIYSCPGEAHRLEDLARISCLSKFHFLRMFTFVYGETPHQFINRVRIERSKELLHSARSIQQIASALGFRDASSFSRLFRQQVGVYPTQFAPGA